MPHFGTNPSFLFDAAAYLAQNPDLAGTVSLGAALQHYLTVGGYEDRNPNSWFDADFFRDDHPDLARLGYDDATLFMHFNLFGIWTGAAPNRELADFDEARYLADNPDVAAYVNDRLGEYGGSAANGALAHYLMAGLHEGRPAFDDGGHQIDPGLFV